MKQETANTIKVVAYDYRNIETPNGVTKLQELCTQYAEAHRIANDMTELEKALKPQILAEVARTRKYEHQIDIDTLITEKGKPVIVQVVKAVIQKIDNVKLKKLVPPTIWEMIKKPEEADPKKVFPLIKSDVIVARNVADAISDETIEKLYVR